jgi:hypothetical protein
VSFQGEYRKGKQTLTYSEPLTEHRDAGIDGELIQDLTENLVNDKQSRDGIPRELFPLRAKDPFCNFTMKGELEHQLRRTYRIGFRKSNEKGGEWLIGPILR